MRLVMRQVLALSRVVAPVAHTSCATHRASCAMSPQTWPFRTFRPPIFFNGQRQCLPLEGRYEPQPCRGNGFRHTSARNSSIIHLEIRLKMRPKVIRMASNAKKAGRHAKSFALQKNRKELVARVLAQTLRVVGTPSQTLIQTPQRRPNQLLAQLT